MAGGIGDLMGGIGGIASALINSKHQARANDIAQENVMMQWMLGSRNIDEQSRLGTRNMDLQEEFGNKNFNLQESNAKKAYGLAEKTGQQQYDLAKEFGGRNLSLQERIAQEQIDQAKASKYDAYGNEVYYDPLSKSFKIRLAPDQQRLMDANKLEEYRRSTIDQAQRRRGLDQNETMRDQAHSMLGDAIRDYKYGAKPVNEGKLANELMVGARESRDENLKAVRQALVSNAMRTGNTSSIEDIGKSIRASGPASFGTDLNNARLGAMQTASQMNNADEGRKANLVNLFSTMSRYAEDPPMGQSPAFSSTSQQANAGGSALAAALSAQGQGVGGALSGYNQAVGGALGGQGSAMINALQSGGQSMGNALTGSAAAQGNAINNLMSALGSAYTSTASGVGEAMSQQAKMLFNTKFDLSGLGQIGKGLGGLAYASGGGGGSSVADNQAALAALRGGNSREKSVF